MWLCWCMHTCKGNDLTITGAAADFPAREASERDNGVTFKNCTPFTKFIMRINNTDIYNAQDIDIVLAIYSLIDYSDNYPKTCESLWPCYKDEPNDNIVDSESFKSKIKITGRTPADRNRKNAEIIVPFK